MRWIVICEPLLIIQPIRSRGGKEGEKVLRPKTAIRCPRRPAASCRGQDFCSPSSRWLAIRYVLYNEEEWNGNFAGICVGEEAGSREHSWGKISRDLHHVLSFHRFHSNSLISSSRLLFLCILSCVPLILTFSLSLSGFNGHAYYCKSCDCNSLVAVLSLTRTHKIMDHAKRDKIKVCFFL